MVNFPGYTITRSVRGTGDFVIYEALRDEDPKEVFIKVPTSQHPSPAVVRQLEQEYEVAHDLDPALVARPLGLERHAGNVALVLKNGAPYKLLSDILGAPMETGRFLKFAIGAAAILVELRKHDLIHKDIKPANLLVDTLGNLRLTCFGIASRLPREHQAPEPPELIAGTLAYMAPEQSGRMNRSTDSRSDLYALGVTFYEMLTGVLPFTATDPIGWVHCHIAQEPIPPAERVKVVPEALSAIVLKLLAKTAEQRYQTALGLSADLDKCLAQWGSYGRIDPFPLGDHDLPDRMLIPEKLYGRESEVDALLAAFDRVVAHGAPELVLVTGYSGIGKSSVVNELHKALVPPRGLLAAGKFDQYKRDVPYATLIQSFQALVHQILSQSEKEVAHWRDTLQEAMSPNGQIIASLIPEIELIIGKQPPVPELPPQDAQNRFQMVCRQFLGIFAQREHPLVLFLDDLQWVDTATLELLKNLIIRQEPRHLLLVGAYRDNEVSPSHPLAQTLEEIRKAGVKIQEIVLAPLGLDDVGRLIADSLHCNRERALPLAQLVHEKTGGNPFFAIQFFTALAEQGLLTFDPDSKAWVWDVARIRAKGFTDNVVDLMVGKLNRLSHSTQKELRQLACLGNIVEISTLTLVADKSEEAIHSALWEAVRAGLIFRLGGTYVFLHDRVQEAAYSLIPEDERASTHLRIGRLLASRMSSSEISEKIFEIVNQLHHGVALITAPEERERVAELNLVAGNRAEASTAYTSALKYFSAGGALLAEEFWERRYELTFALEFHRARCEYLTGDLAAAEERLAMLSQRAGNLVDSAAVTGVRVNLFTTLDRSDRSIEVSLEYLRRLGVHWSPHPSRNEVRQEFERIWQQLGSRSIEDLVNFPAMSDPGWRATMDVLTTALTPALFTDENLLGLVVGRMANLSLEHGNSDGSGIGYAFLGMLLGPYLGKYEAGARFAWLGVDLVEKRGLDRFKARVYLHVGNVVNPWTRHFRTGMVLIRRAFETADRMGDISYAVYSCNHLITNLLATGDPLGEVQREAETGLDFARKARFGLIVDIITGQLRLIRSLRGLMPDFYSSTDTELDEAGFERHLEEDPRLAIAACWYWIRKLQERFFAGDYLSAIESESKAEALIWTSPSHVELAEYHFYGALARAAMCDAASINEQPRHLMALTSHHKQLAEWAEHCPENFANRAALVAAEIARIEGRDLEAMRLYEQAIRSARENGFVQNAALAYELASAFYRARGFELFADTCLREARYCYVRWGADGKVKRLDELHPRLAQTTPLDPATVSARPEQLDVMTVAKAQHAISSEIAMDRLAETLLRIMLENAGAEKGYLHVEPDSDLFAVVRPQHGESHIEFNRASPRSASNTSASILNYVKRTRKTVILNDASTDAGEFSADEYLRRTKPKSVLCVPIMRQTKLIGVLYLENNLTAGAFTPSHRSVLEILAAQAAISLEVVFLIQQEHEARDALKKSESRFRRISESNMIGIVFGDLSGNILEANDYFLQTVDYTREDLEAGQMRWKELTPPEYFPEDEKAIQELNTHGRCRPYEKEHIRKDGSRVPILLGSSFLEGSQSEVVSYVMDITDRKRTEIQRDQLLIQERQARFEAEKAIRSRDEFMMIAAHELRTPLTPLKMQLHLLRNLLSSGSHPIAPERQMKLLKSFETSDRQLDQLLRLVDDILDVSTISGGDLTLNVEPSDLSEMVRSVVKRHQSKLMQANCTLELHAEKRVTGQWDRLRIEQAITNLLTNATKYGAGKPVEVIVSEAGDRAKLVVRDHGIGIEKKDQQRIFDCFERAVSVQHFGGFGLGLYISRQIAQAHGGTLRVESQLGEGSTFTMEIKK